MTPTQAATILSLIEGISLRELLEAKALSAVEALSTLSQSCIGDVFVYSAPGKKIECIKLVRCITLMGLKEAKDLVDELTSKNPEGWIGPIKRTSDIENEKARIFTLCQDNRLDMSFVRIQAV